MTFMQFSSLVDGTPHLFWDNDDWFKIPANRDLKEPKITIADTIQVVNPEAKIIILLRNPIDR